MAEPTLPTLLLIYVTVAWARNPSMPVAFSIGGALLWLVCNLVAARKLYRAAVSPVQREMRYVLLSDPGRKGAPSLVLFASKDAAAQADAVLPLHRPVGHWMAWLHPALDRSSPAVYLSRLPAPSGTVLLRGGPGTKQLLVPWIEGRPYWPDGPVVWGECDTEGFQALLNRLLAPRPTWPAPTA